jgi:CBS domain-containing protein
MADSHDDGLRKMKQAGCRHLPVVDGDRLVGMVSQRDLLQIDLSQKDEEIRWLNAYIHFIPPGREGTS